MGAMSIILPLVVLALAIGWGFFIGMRRTRARFFVVLACLVFAIIMTVSFRSVTFATLDAQLSPLVKQADSEMLTDLWDMIEGSKAMQQIAVSGGTALAAPLVFAASFVGASVVSWIICYIIFIIAAIVRASSGKHRRRARPARTIIYASLQWIITLFVLVTPVACYLACLPDMVDVAADTGMLKEMGITEADARKAAEDAESDPLVTVYNALGGKKIVASMTSFTVGKEETTIGKEMTALAKFGGNLIRLSDSEIKNYGTKEAELMENLSDCFEDSLLLPSIGGEIIWYATDAWDNGESFMGIEKPDLGKDDTTKMFAEAFDHILEAFQSDARNTDNLREDFATVASLVKIMAEDGVFSAMQESSTNALIDKLSNGTTISDMVGVLHGNSRFSVLVTDITNIGMRFIAEALQLPKNAEEIYKNFTTEIADAVNEVRASGKSATELAAELKTALDNSGVEFTTDTSVLELYATSLLEDLDDLGDETVTPEDIEEYFKAFGTVSGESTSASSGDGDVLYLSEKKNGGLFGHLTQEELRKNTMAGITQQFLASLQTLAKQNLTQEAFTEQAKAEMERLLNASDKYRSGKRGEELREKLMAIIDEMKSEAVQEDLVSKAASLGDPKTMKTALVTEEDLLTGASDSSSLTDEQKRRDAEAIQKIFSKASSIKEALDNSDNSQSGLGGVSDAIGDLGAMLDDLSGLSSVGEDKTNKLATAVMQSETVRKSTGLTPKEAAEMVNKMTEAGENGEKPKFEDTLASLSDGADIIAKLKNNEKISEEETHKLLEKMTPQMANALVVLINEDRMGDFGVKDESKRAVSAELIRNLLREMGDSKTYGKDVYAKETAGVTKLFDLAMAASKQNGKTHLFTHDSEDTDGVLGSADEVVSAILGSKMVCRAVDNTMQQGKDETKVNPFGLKTAHKDSKDYTACKEAIEKYAAAHPELNPDYIKSVCALFGIEYDA